MRDIQKQVGSRVRELREQKGISQEALAGICSLHRTYVGLIERGERNLSLSTIAVLAEGLGVAPAELFVSPRVKNGSPRTPTSAKKPALIDVGAHIAAIRRVLIDAKLTDLERYQKLYDQARKSLPE